MPFCFYGVHENDELPLKICLFDIKSFLNKYSYALLRHWVDNLLSKTTLSFFSAQAPVPSTTSCNYGLSLCHITINQHICNVYEIIVVNHL